MFLCVVQHAAKGSVGPAHHPLHAVGGADEMTFIDAPHAACADEEVLVVVGHAHHFVRHDLPDGEHQVVAALPNEPIELGGPGAVPDPLGHAANVRSRHLADGHHVVPPVVLAEKTRRQTRKHPRDLPVGHRAMGAQGGHHVGQARAEVFVGQTGQWPGHAVGAG